jgi:hypothetical protein
VSCWDCCRKEPWRLSEWLLPIQALAAGAHISGTLDGVFLEEQVRIVPVFAGTAVRGFSEKSGSGVYPCTFTYGVGLLPAKVMVANFWQLLVPAHALRTVDFLEVKLSALAGHMRLVECFVEEMAGIQRKVPWAELVSRCRELTWDIHSVNAAVEQATASVSALCGFQSWLIDSCRCQLIAALVLGVALSEAAVLDGESIDSILQRAPVVVSRLQSGSVVLSTSALLLANMCTPRPMEEGPQEAFKAAVRDLVLLLVQSSPLSTGFEAFEGICARFLAIQKMGYAVLGQRWDLRAVFRGAMLFNGAGSLPFGVADSVLSRIDVVRSKSQLPGESVVCATSFQVVKISCEGPVVLNASSAPFADVVFRAASGVDVLVACKRYALTKLTSTVVCDEVEKVAKSSSAWDLMAPAGEVPLPPPTRGGAVCRRNRMLVWLLLSPSPESLCAHPSPRCCPEGKLDDAGLGSVSFRIVLPLRYFFGSACVINPGVCKVVVVLSVGRLQKKTATAFSTAAEGSLFDGFPTVVVALGNGLEELFGPLLSCVALHCRQEYVDFL